MHRKLIIIIIIIFMHSKLTQVCGKADSRRKALDMIRTKITEVSPEDTYTLVVTTPVLSMEASGDSALNVPIAN
ncbi:hypothetical protein M8J77_001356 [Diaphorina citri]|nr:hypothetical protein M8J77_001356 [Diaphorina citri]